MGLVKLSVMPRAYLRVQSGGIVLAFILFDPGLSRADTCDQGAAI